MIVTLAHEKKSTIDFHFADEFEHPGGIQLQPNIAINQRWFLPVFRTLTDTPDLFHLPHFRHPVAP